MLHNTAILLLLLLLCSIPRVAGWAINPGPTCDHCCCCVVIANYGTRNFYAENSGGFLMTTIPSCYFLQTHLNDVIADWESQGIGVGDGDTFSGQYSYWLPTDPADGCYNDLATVTATNFNDGPTPTIGGVGPTSSTGGSSTTSPQTNGGNNGGNSLSDRIALGVGLVVGLPAAITAIWK